MISLLEINCAFVCRVRTNYWKSHGRCANKCSKNLVLPWFRKEKIFEGWYHQAQSPQIQTSRQHQSFLSRRMWCVPLATRITRAASIRDMQRMVSGVCEKAKRMRLREVQVDLRTLLSSVEIKEANWTEDSADIRSSWWKTTNAGSMVLGSQRLLTTLFIGYDTHWAMTRTEIEDAVFTISTSS